MFQGDCARIERPKGELVMLKNLIRFIKDEEAPTAVEYAIMVAGIAVVIIAVVFLLGTNVRNTINRVAIHVPGP
jgi:pilus assembly protein Flp/PilA